MLCNRNTSIERDLGAPNSLPEFRSLKNAIETQKELSLEVAPTTLIWSNLIRQRPLAVRSTASDQCALLS